MGKTEKEFGDDLEKLAEISDLLEKSFIGNQKTKIEVFLNEGTFSDLLKNLRINQNETKCVISISNTDFTFLKM